MVRRATLSALALAGAVVSGAAMGYAAERRALRGQVPAGDEWEELRRPVEGRPRTVESFDGTRLHVEELGTARAGAVTLVFAHAYALSQHAFHYQRRDLPDRFRCIFYDQRGHGRSGAPPDGDYSIEALGRDLAAVIEATTADDERLVLVGHSMGGMTVLSLAEQRPGLVAEQVAGVVLADTAANDVVTGGAPAAGIAAVAALRSAVWDRGLRVVGRRPEAADRLARSSDLTAVMTRAIGLSPKATPAQVAFTEQLLLAVPSSVKAALGPALSSLDLREAARRLRAPALVLVGGHDRVTPPAAARRLAELLGEAELVELPDVGHMAPLEAADDVTRLVGEFAGGLSAPTGRRARGRR